MSPYKELSKEEVEALALLAIRKYPTTIGWNIFLNRTDVQCLICDQLITNFH